MDRSNSSQKSFIHPSRAHLFHKADGSDANFSSVKNQHTSRTWNNRTQKASENKSESELLVFGYASKLFPPNSQSATIAKNKHLIAWNEDYNLNLLIDRYDCRASLHNLSEFDGDSWNKIYQLSEEEAKLEEYLDEERYRALYVEELEEDIRQEEELKRLHASIAENPNQQSKYGQVGYQYGGDAGEQYDPTEPTNDEVDQKPFIAPTSLAIPQEMEIPATEKMHAIIEKTALFVSKQGTQMEIVLKAKQANNSQFQFLQFGHYLNPYYKHVVKRIKDGKYTPGAPQEPTEEDDSDSSDDGDYLHPSLFASAHRKHDLEKEEKTKAIRTVDPDHPLAKLIEKGRQANAIKQYKKMAEAVYGYYHQQQENMLNGSTDSKVALTNVEPPPLPSFMTMNTDYSSTETSNLPQFHSEYNVATQSSLSDNAQQASLHSSSTTDPPWKGYIVPPPPDMQSVVEEIAKKVATEGEVTEKALICQAEPNYSFLNPWHELHPYYQFRKLSWTRVLFPPPPPDADGTAVKSDLTEEVDQTTSSTPEEIDSQKPAIPAAPISFSIKPRKDGTKKPLLLASTNSTMILGDVESDEDKDSKQPVEVETKKEKSTKRRFTIEPPDDVKVISQAIAPPVMVATTKPAIVLPKADSVPPSVKTVTTVAIQPAISNFTAVTPSGESASIKDLREKQAARRQKALMFLKAKSEQEAAAANSTSTSAPSHKVSEENKLAAIASEDIFDLSTPSEQDSNNQTTTTHNPLPENDDKIPPPKLDVFQKLASNPSSSSSSPRSSSGRANVRSRSRSRSVSRTKDVSLRHDSGSRDLPSSYSSSKLGLRESSSSYKNASGNRSPSPIGDNGVPSAYRVENYSRRQTSRGSREHKSERKRISGLNEDSKRHKSRRSGSRSRKSSGRHNKRRRNRSGSGERKKKKRKKEKKEKKHKRKTKSSSSSHDEEEDGELRDEELRRMDEEQVDDSVSDDNKSEGDVVAPLVQSGAGDVTKKERSEGELESD